jgi:pimeloyl-ACP methyl ester carboxylesterase
MSTDAPSKPTIVLIHGLWLTALSWEHWKARYEAEGYPVIAQSWPGMGGDIDALRADPSAIEHLGIGEIADYYAELIDGLDDKPIIMGHSFGAVITQILLDRGYGRAGVSIDSGPVKGVLSLPPSELKSGFPVLKSPANVHKAVPLTAKQFHYAFTNTLTEEESQPVYERYAVPGPGRVLFQGALANFNPHAANRIDFHNDDRAPLLIVAGGVDHVSPVSINEELAKRQGKSGSITGYKEFAGRSHYTVGQDGWEEVADFALSWALDPTAIDEPA